MEPKKLLQEELQKISQLTNKEKDTIQELGIIEYQIILLEQQKDKLKITIKDIQTQQNQLSKTLQEKYGEGNIDLVKGEITPLS